jgi:hypothetical protein
MSTTVSTHNHRVPLIASAAVAAVIAGAGLVGLAWNSSDSASHNPELRTPTAQDYQQYNYYHGAQPYAGLDRFSMPTPDVQGVGPHGAPGALENGGLDRFTLPSPPATPYGGKVQQGE